MSEDDEPTTYQKYEFLVKMDKKYGDEDLIVSLMGDENYSKLGHYGHATKVRKFEKIKEDYKFEATEKKAIDEIYEKYLGIDKEREDVKAARRKLHKFKKSKRHSKSKSKTIKKPKNKTNKRSKSKSKTNKKSKTKI